MDAGWPCVGCGEPTSYAWGGIVPCCGRCDWEEFKRRARNYLAERSLLLFLERTQVNKGEE